MEVSLLLSITLQVKGWSGQLRYESERDKDEEFMKLSWWVTHFYYFCLLPTSLSLIPQHVHELTCIVGLSFLISVLMYMYFSTCVLLGVDHYRTTCIYVYIAALIRLGTVQSQITHNVHVHVHVYNYPHLCIYTIVFIIFLCSYIILYLRGAHNEKEKEPTCTCLTQYLILICLLQLYMYMHSLYFMHSLLIFFFLFGGKWIKPFP